MVWAGVGLQEETVGCNCLKHAYQGTREKVLGRVECPLVICGL